MKDTLIIMLYLAGAGQIFIALIYDQVRYILGWDADIARMAMPWNRQIAHTYSRYIQALNLAFGLITVLLAPAFFEGNAIATAFAALLTLYWGGRMVVALFYYDTQAITKRRALYRFGAWGFHVLFTLMIVTYAAVVAVNL